MRQNGHTSGRRHIEMLTHERSVTQGQGTRISVTWGRRYVRVVTHGEGDRSEW